SRKRTADNNLAVWLCRDGINIAVRVWVKRIGRSCSRIKAGDVIAHLLFIDGGKLTADEDFAVRLHGDGINLVARVGVEDRVEGTVWVQSGDAVTRDSRNTREHAPDDDLAIWLKNGGVEKRVHGKRTGVDDEEIERLIECAVDFQP